MAQEAFEQLTLGHKPRYFLFLRPFSADPVVPHKLKKPSWRIGNILEVFEDTELSLNEVIYRAVRKVNSDFPLITLRGRRPSGIGENQKTIDINDWQTFVINAAENASLILMLLGASHGLMTELGHLAQRRLFQKTVFVMPPTSERPVAYLVRNRGVLEEESKELYETLCNVGLHPPLPIAAGQVIFFGANTHPVHTEWTWDGRALAKMIELALRESALRPQQDFAPEGLL
jgi:hypothetical protein